MAKLCVAGVAPPTVYVKVYEDGFTAMALILKVTAMGELADEPPWTTMLAVKVSAGRPVGSAEMTTAAGVVPAKPKDCPFALSQGELVYERVKAKALPLLLVILIVWVTGEPPTCP